MKIPVSLDGSTLMSVWEHLSALPGGKTAFSLAIGQMAPYTGTLGARVEALSPGHARVVVLDRRGIRNHLDSIHAIALANLAEMSTGLAVVSGLPKGSRGIITQITIDYLHKARGRLTAECRVDPLGEVTEPRELLAVAEISDPSGQVVARGRACWRVGPSRR
ncbi:MAG: DUF4442 domain-containing protein [Deltaproteobacteria bacterium]|nr:DUF4442 domain-containing protein [Deltaproteobacteria bacterium]